MGATRGTTELDEGIAAWTTARSGDEIVAALRSRGIPVGKALQAPVMYDDPQLVARGYYQPLDHAKTGVRRYPGWPMRFSFADAHHRRGAPTLGQHNREILTELGVSDERDRPARRGRRDRRPDAGARLRFSLSRRARARGVPRSTANTAARSSSGERSSTVSTCQNSAVSRSGVTSTDHVAVTVEVDPLPVRQTVEARLLRGARLVAVTGPPHLVVEVL